MHNTRLHLFYHKQLLVILRSERLESNQLSCIWFGYCLRELNEPYWETYDSMTLKKAQPTNIWCWFWFIISWADISQWLESNSLWNDLVESLSMLSQVFEIAFKSVNFGLEVLQLPHHLLGLAGREADIPENLHVQIVRPLDVHVLGEAQGDLQTQSYSQS